MAKEISFSVEGSPPAKNEAQTLLGARHSDAPRVLALLSAAREKAHRVGFTGFAEQPIGLELVVACPRDRNRSDANYLGGVADVLEDKAHRVNLEHLGDLASFGLDANDSQIEEVRYHWEPRETPS